MNPKVDEFLSKVSKWQQEMAQLRTIVLDCGLVEELKWGVPCYTFGKANILLIHGFKEYCAIAFFKGALLNDAEGILIQQTENVQAGRQIRFTSLQQILDMQAIVKAYIYEAIEVEKAGLKIDYKKSEEFDMPEELQQKLNADAKFRKAFYDLSSGRQKGYILYFSTAKQSQTRISRIEQYTQRIFDGKGFNDCVCGLSKKMPNCDGSHKQLKS